MRFLKFTKPFFMIGTEKFGIKIKKETTYYGVLFGNVFGVAIPIPKF